MDKRDAIRRLLRHGLVVFLLGLGTGLVMIVSIRVFKNPRLALASHLVGVTTGMFLLIFGFVVERIEMSPRALVVTFWSALYGAYGNWAGTTFGAVFGTRAMTAIAGAGYAGDPWQEAVVVILLATSGIATTVACVLVLIGLGKRW